MPPAHSYMYSARSDHPPRTDDDIYDVTCHTCRYKMPPAHYSTCQLADDDIYDNNCLRRDTSAVNHSTPTLTHHLQIICMIQSDKSTN